MRSYKVRSHHFKITTVNKSFSFQTNSLPVPFVKYLGPDLLSYIKIFNTANANNAQLLGFIIEHRLD